MEIYTTSMLMYATNYYTNMNPDQFEEIIVKFFEDSGDSVASESHKINPK